MISENEKCGDPDCPGCLAGELIKKLRSLGFDPEMILEMMIDLINVEYEINLLEGYPSAYMAEETEVVH